MCVTLSCCWDEINRKLGSEVATYEEENIDIEDIHRTETLEIEKACLVGIWWRVTFGCHA